MDTPSITQMIILLILLMLSALFSSAETAYTSVQIIRLDELIEEGNKAAINARKLLDNKTKLLSAILILNNVINLSASALTTTMAMRIWGNSAIALATGVLTFILIIFGEICPKNLATVKNEELTLAYAGILVVCVSVLTPIIFIVDKFSGTLLKLMRIDPFDSKAQLTEFQLRTIVEASQQDGVIESEERQMITNVVDFGDSCAKDVMIPKVDISSVDVNAGFEEIKTIFFENKYTRIPVYEDTQDNIVGVLNMKDILFYENYDGFSIRNIMREPNFTFEYKKTSDLLAEMREKSIAMIFVLDEYGATVGLITLEDLLEEIVGEIRDEFDEDEENLITKIDERTFKLEGTLKLDDINDALELELNSTDYDSISGLIIEKLEHIPEVGETVVLEDGTTLTVDSMDKNHIEKVTMILPAEESEA